ncbi:hypothetical protein GCM10022275_23040 [Tessaracoccus defluvii]
MSTSLPPPPPPPGSTPPPHGSVPPSPRWVSQPAPPPPPPSPQPIGIVPEPPRFAEDSNAEGAKDFVVTVLLSFFLGMFGADRFYLGKTRSGVWKLVTFGGFGYWWLFDLVLTLIGRQRDAAGHRLQGYGAYKWTVWILAGSVFAASVIAGLIGAVWTIATGADTESASTSMTALMFPLAAGIAVLAFRYRRRRSGPKPVQAPAHPRDPLPPKIRTHVEKLSALRQAYVLQAAAGTDAAAPFVSQIESLIQNVTELFRRLGSKADASQRAYAVTEYDDVLSKLAGALDRDYILDVLMNPRFWDNPAERVASVQGALRAVDRQLVDNIRQVNADRGLEFQVGVEGIRDMR